MSNDGGFGGAVTSALPAVTVPSGCQAGSTRSGSYLLRAAIASLVEVS
jgi:hypothetical protein